MPRIEDLKIKIFADGADLKSMVELAKNPLIKGFTTNPTLMRQAGVTDYAGNKKDCGGQRREVRTPLGKHARTVEHLSGGRSGSGHHHGHTGHPEENSERGQGPGTVFSRNRPDVLRRWETGRLRAIVGQ